MLTATYGESVISTPMYESGEPSGPMLNGTTYIVRPRIAPRNSSSSFARISAGSIQLLVGPASASRSEQMKVRSSTRATSLGSVVAQYEPGACGGVELDEGARVDELLAEQLVLLVGAVEPVDGVGLAQRSAISSHPAQQPGCGSVERLSDQGHSARCTDGPGSRLDRVAGRP